MLVHVCPDVGRLHIPDEEFAKSLSMGFWLPPKDLSAWRAECCANEPDPSMPEGRFLRVIPYPTLEVTFENHCWQKQEVLKGMATLAGTLVRKCSDQSKCQSVKMSAQALLRFDIIAA